MTQTQGWSLKNLWRTSPLLSLLHTTAEEEHGAGGAHTRLWRGSRRRQRRGGGADVVVIFVNVSMGRHFPRSLGYMSRLGMGFIPIGGGGSATIVDWRLCPKSTGERIYDKSCPNLTISIHDSSGYARARLPITAVISGILSIPVTVTLFLQ